MTYLASPALRVASGRLTTAQVNAGKVVVDAVVKRSITVVDAWVRAIGGAASANTSVDIVDSVSGTVVVAFTNAGLLENVVLRVGTATTGVGTNVGVSLGRGEGLKVKNTGTAMATATNLDYVILFKVEAVDATL